MAFVLTSGNLYLSPLLQKMGWLDHGFGTSAASPIHVGEMAASLVQIHSTLVNPVSKPGERQAKGDGLVTTTPNLWISIRTADCLPILMADRKLKIVAAVHAGWKGTVHQIARKSVACLIDEFGSNPDDLYAAIGPGISECCFEVGPEVAIQFDPIFLKLGKTNNPFVNLKQANVSQLLLAGLSLNHIDVADECSMSTPGFHSFRRDKTDGRMVSAIRITKGAA